MMRAVRAVQTVLTAAWWCVQTFTWFAAAQLGREFAAGPLTVERSAQHLGGIALGVAGLYLGDPEVKDALFERYRMRRRRYRNSRWI